MNIKEYHDAIEKLIPNSDIRDRVLGLTVGIMAELKQSVYAVVAVDCGDSCSGHGSCVGVFKSKAEAEAYVRNDMEDRCDQLAGCDIKADFDRMEILNSCDEPICLWSIDEVEVK